MKERRAIVSGYGLVTALGNQKQEVWYELMAGRSAARNWEDLEKEGFRFTKACRVMENTDTPAIQRGAWFADQALHIALADAQIDIPENTGIFIGSTIGESGAFEAIASGTVLDPYRYTLDSFATLIQKKLKTRGITYSYGTACTAGNYAIGAAASAIREGLTEVAIAGGIEPFSRVAMTGFSRSRAMTSDHCRPFDRDRNGMMLGEGAAIFILEEEQRALARNVKPLAVIGPLGLSCDAYHPTAPLEDGSGIIRAMRTAIRLEKIEPNEVDWICAHGSGTFVSDKAEAEAIRSLFGSSVAVSGLKGAFGHALGAATAIEAAICLMALQNETIPPTVNLINPDPDFNINLITNAVGKELNYILNCGYAFGGLNSALLIKKWK